MLALLHRRRNSTINSNIPENKVIKQSANIRDFYSRTDEENTVDTMTSNSDISPKVYDLRTPMKKRKSEKTDNKQIVLLSDQSTDIQSNKKGTAKRRTTSSLQATSLSEVFLDDASACYESGT